MKVFKPLALGLLTRPYEFQRRFHLGVAVLCFIPLGPEPALFAETAMWKFLAEELPPDQALDAGIPKRLGEFLVIGRAYAPAGTTVRARRVSVRIGERRKELLVVGDRYREGDRATEPLPFAEMPIDWRRAYGGPGVADNPLGKGTVAVDLPGIGPRVPLPNVEDPAQPAHQRHRIPAGFGPIDPAWPHRARLVGTHDDTWLREDFPGFARDIDWRFFNIAPPDQWLPRPFTGDEEYALENMHPEEPQITGRLPGIAPRLFLARRGAEDALEEIPLALTTVWFFPHRRRAVLVHHGRADITEEDGRDVARIVLGADRRRDALRPVEHFRAVMLKRLDPEYGAIHALRDSDLAPPELLIPDPALEADKALFANEGLLQKRNRRRAEREIAKSRAYVASLGLDPDKHGPTEAPPEEPPPSLDDLPARIERALAEAERQQAEARRWKEENDQALKALLPGTGMTFEQLEAERTQRPAGPPSFTAEGQRRSLRVLADQLRAAGADVREIEEILADPAMNGLWEAAEEQQREGYRLTAQSQDPAPPMPAAQRRRVRREVEAARAEGRSLARANLCGADLSGLDLSGLDLSEAWLDGANLQGANLGGARLAKAVLAHAAMEQCRLDGADLSEANLGRARLRGARFAGARLKDAILAGVDLREAVLRGADLQGADLSEAQLDGADLTEAQASGVVFFKTAVPGLRAPGAVLDKAKFIEAELTEADFTGASLVEALFVRTAAQRIRCAGADMRKAGFVEGCALDGANLVRANLAEANLRGARLAGANLSDAVLDGADLSDCDLRQARLDHARARGARFVVADLRHAVLARGDFMSGMLGRADLRGADLSDASFYEADLARVRTDQETRAERMLQTRMRVRPRYRAQ